MSVQVPEFMKQFKPTAPKNKELNDILSNWVKAHRMINTATKSMSLHEAEQFVGSLLYSEIMGRRRMHMIGKLKGRLSFLSRDREEKDLLTFVASVEADNAGKSTRSKSS